MYEPYFIDTWRLGTYALIDLPEGQVLCSHYHVDGTFEESYIEGKNGKKYVDFEKTLTKLGIPIQAIIEAAESEICSYNTGGKT